MRESFFLIEMHFIDGPLIRMNIGILCGAVVLSVAGFPSLSADVINLVGQSDELEAISAPLCSPSIRFFDPMSRFYRRQFNIPP